MIIKFTWEDDEGVEYEETLPAKYEVCNRCKGFGTTLAESIGSHAYTREEFEEAFTEDEDREAYFTRGGKYDVPCGRCDGKRVVAVVDESNADKEVLSKYNEIMDQKARRDSEDRATYRLENGGYGE